MHISEAPPEYLTRADGVQLAFRKVGHSRKMHGKGQKPAIVFLPGYMSDMAGTKALALEAMAIKHGLPMLRFDYAGCGQSGGNFADCTLTGWCDDALLVIDMLVRGPVILAGSSMGGWLMLHVGERLGDQLVGMVGIAAAPDFTDWDFSAEDIGVVERDAVLYRPNPYGDTPTPFHRGLYRSGRELLILHREIAIDCPVRLLHGQMDGDVPWEISLKLAAALRSSDVQLHLIKDGDHRLSRPGDIAVLIDNIRQMLR